MRGAGFLSQHWGLGMGVLAAGDAVVVGGGTGQLELGWCLSRIRTRWSCAAAVALRSPLSLARHWRGSVSVDRPGADSRPPGVQGRHLHPGTHQLSEKLDLKEPALFTRQILHVELQ